MKDEFVVVPRALVEQAVRYLNPADLVVGPAMFASCAHDLRELLAAPASQAAGAVDDYEDAVESILNRLEGWAKAYPVDMFHEPTAEERDWLHATKPGLMDCIAASMGRHIASCIASDLAELRRLTPPSIAGASVTVDDAMVLRACNAYDHAREYVDDDESQWPAMHAALKAALSPGGAL